MYAIVKLLVTVINIYIWVLIASAIMSWLVAFNVVNRYNPIVNSIGRFLHAVTDPLLRPIRRIVPLLGGVDVSPVILILLLVFLRDLIIEYAYR